MPFEIIRNDITTMKVDAIVNAANRSLLGGGGVDGAIHRAAGPELLEECRTLGGCETGDAKITGGYRLPARHVIHTVGPVWHGGTHGERELLASCYRRSLELAAENGCESVAFPMISAGAYGYPKDQAMAVAVEEITRFLFDHDMTVYLVVFGHESFCAGKKLFRDVREYIDDVYAESHARPRSEAKRRRRWQEDEAAALREDIAAGAALQEEMLMADALPDSPEPTHALMGAPSDSLIDRLKKTDEGFSPTLLRLIDERGMTDAECYKRANIDKKLFSKIRSNADYKPSKPTVFAFAIALGLSLRETKMLLNRAGFSLSHCSKFDIAMEYFILNRYSNVHEINEILFDLDMPLLGSVTK